MNRTEAIVVLGLGLGGCDTVPERPRPSLEHPTIVFVVLDTVRADHMSMCGYERPTTPFLSTFAAAPGTDHTCWAYSPGSWTLPSHASYFTGVPLDVHGAHMVAGGVDVGDGWLSIRPLGPELPTVAERLGARGYQSFSISANPLVGPVTGLTRGFDAVHVVDIFMSLRGQEMADRLLQSLDEDVDPTRPLFLFLNLSDAHQPLANPKPGHSFVDVSDHPRRKEFRGLIREFKLWTHPDQAAAKAWVKDLYDVGIESADRTLDLALQALGGRGWLDGPHRITVTSDHGEHLGGKQIYGHGGDVLEPTVRVPVVHRSVPPVRLTMDRPFPAGRVHELVLHGELEEDAETPETLAMPWAQKAAINEDRTGAALDAARWVGTRKFRTKNGVQTVIDLELDPTESGPVSGGLDPAEAAALASLEARLAKANGRAVEIDPEMVEMLKAAGYIVDE